MFWIELKQGYITPKTWGVRPSDGYMEDLRMSYRDPQTLLFEAIFGGNTLQVKQLINSGIDKNTVLHSPVRWEGASVLGTAAYEGHIDIVKFLVEAGTSVNFTDPCLGRSALHWACMGNQFQIVKYLLDQGADVNCTDKDKVTPIIRSTINNNLDITVLLIEHGAKINCTDRLRSSPLHYASVHGNSKLVQTVIKAGCVHNGHAILGKGTPLANIFHHNDRISCIMLLEAGYNISNDLSWILQLHDVNTSDNNLNNEIIDDVFRRKRNPLSLMGSCRLVVRSQMGGVCVDGKIQKLDVPYRIKQYLLFEIK